MSERPRTLLYFPLTLLPQKAEHEATCIKALASLNGAVDGILLALSSWQEVPLALSHPLVIEVLARCARYGITVHLGRDLWIRWKDRAIESEWRQGQDDVFNSAYYAAYLSRLAAEATAIGAHGTFAECEPQGDTVFKPWFKSTGFSPEAHFKVVKAIALARQVSPGATLVRPVGSHSASHYSYALQNLGDQQMNRKSYECHGVRHLRAISTLNRPLVVHWWGAWLTTDHHVWSDNNPLTVAEMNGMAWDVIQHEYPECQGRWFHVEQDDMIEVMGQLGRANGR